MAGQRCGTSDGATEQRFAEAVIAAYLDAVPGGEASFAELRALLLECAIEPQRVMPYAQRLLLRPAGVINSDKVFGTHSS